MGVSVCMHCAYCVSSVCVCMHNMLVLMSVLYACCSVCVCTLCACCLFPANLSFILEMSKVVLAPKSRLVWQTILLETRYHGNTNSTCSQVANHLFSVIIFILVRSKGFEKYSA